MFAPTASLENARKDHARALPIEQRCVYTECSVVRTSAHGSPHLRRRFLSNDLAGTLRVEACSPRSAYCSSWSCAYIRPRRDLRRLTHSPCPATSSFASWRSSSPEPPSEPLAEARFFERASRMVGLHWCISYGLRHRPASIYLTSCYFSGPPAQSGQYTLRPTDPSGGPLRAKRRPSAASVLAQAHKADGRVVKKGALGCT